ncbi:MAG: hypothetical protein U0228_03265 [Myxococcaceae bacterium]
MDTANRISMTPTVARQTPHNEFGNVLKNTLQTAVQAGTAFLGNVAGSGIISTAVSSVTALAGAGQGTAQGLSAASGVASINTNATAPGLSATAQTLASSPNGVPQEMSGMISQMRAEADRSMLVQMQMQQESREYNTLTNVLKVRHDSAKSAINNIR